MTKTAANKLDMVSIRLVKDAPLLSDKPVHTQLDATDLAKELICDMDRETICVINLKTNGTPINATIASIGTVDCSVTSTREIFKSAILSNAHHIIMLHNHPSGNARPSSEDEMITKKILDAGELLDIKLVDHIIVTQTDTYSFCESGLLNELKNSERRMNNHVRGR